MKTFVKVLGLAALAAMPAAGAQALTTASLVDCDGGVCGTGPSGSRENTASINFNSPADGAFYSLGLGGHVTYKITPPAFGDGVVIEVTFGDRSGYGETGKILGSNDRSTFTQLGTFSSDVERHTFDTAGTAYSYIRFLDTTATGGRSRDGIEVDAFSVSVVPLPAGAVLLLTAIGGMILSRRRSAA